MYKNCINCGAPIEKEQNKCKYCNTSYFDFTAIDFDKNEPVALKFRFNNMIINMLAIPILGKMTSTADTIAVYSHKGSKIKEFTTARSAEFEVSFKAIENKAIENKGTLYTLEVEK